ncbi:response regulator [Oceanobacillus senegalensis]|uniref:response regulator n=1 Tax=Oceanobacillus senegalensis TaxID=1936063 RepID=UPI000A30A6DE|nr:response regulator [Oceanobacillus senegalensis]
MIRVAIAEDDFRVAKIHEAYIEKIEGMCVIGSAINAVETLDLLNKQSVDLLLLDIYMPDRLGTELLWEIREYHPGLDIIMITASTDKEFLEKSLGYGVFHYLIKPVDLQKFNQTMDQYKKKKQLFQEAKEVNQNLLESIFGMNQTKISQGNLPSGIDSVTLRKVMDLLQSFPNGMTSEKVGEKMGASRTTARRYLEYLVGTGYLKAESVYGIVGRPERRYYLQERKTNI